MFSGKSMKTSMLCLIALVLLVSSIQGMEWMHMDSLSICNCPKFGKFKFPNPVEQVCGFDGKTYTNECIPCVLVSCQGPCPCGRIDEY